MGLERIASVMQGQDTNYHIDILRPIVEAAGEIVGLPYDPASEEGRRLRRICDHVRAVHSPSMRMYIPVQTRRSMIYDDSIDALCLTAIRWANANPSCINWFPLSQNR